MDWQRLRGSLVALVTPFLENGDVDVPALKKLIDFHLKYGTNGLVVSGTTGEGATLSPEQFRTVIETCVKRIKGTIPVIAGTGSNNTRVAIGTTQLAKELGVDAALVVGPYYNKPTQDGYVHHFRTIAEAVDLPIILYNVPGRTASNIDWRTTLQLSNIPNIIGIKEASGDLVQISHLIRKRDPNFLVWSGDDMLTLPILALGADGVISVVANEVPDLMRKLVEAAMTGDLDTARKIHYEILPLMLVNFVETSPIPVKCALSMMGFIDENYHLPLIPITEVNRMRIKNILQDLSILPRGNNTFEPRY